MQSLLFIFFLIKSLLRSVCMLLLCRSLSCQASRWGRAPCALQGSGPSSRKTQATNNFLDPELNTQQGPMSSVLSKSLDIEMFFLFFLSLVFSCKCSKIRHHKPSQKTGHLKQFSQCVYSASWVPPQAEPLLRAAPGSPTWSLKVIHPQVSGFHLLFPSLPQTGKTDVAEGCEGG